MNHMRPELAGLLSVWQSLCNGQPMPSRSDLDPEDIKPWLRNISIFDVERAPCRFRHRLVGTKLVEYQGHDLTGTYLPNAEDPISARLSLTDFELCADTGEPVHRTARYGSNPRDEAMFERLLLPLGSNHTTADKILMGFYLDEPIIVPATASDLYAYIA